MFRQSIEWADHLITVSEYSKSQIIDYLGLKPENVSVVYNGVDDAWWRDVVPSEINAVMAKYKITKNYCLMVGTVQQRKNFALAIDAYSKLPKSLQNDYCLIGVGGENGQYSVISNKKAEAAGIVTWHSNVSKDDLIVLMKVATCLLFPSLAEGFGLPVLEAFAAGCPVLASNTTCIPEISGGAAMLVDPNNVDKWADGLEGILLDSAIRKSLISRGLLRAKEFSWQHSAIETTKIYRAFSS